MTRYSERHGAYQN